MLSCVGATNDGWGTSVGIGHGKGVSVALSGYGGVSGIIVGTRLAIKDGEGSLSAGGWTGDYELVEVQTELKTNHSVV